MSDNIIVFPQFNELQNEIRELKKNLCDLIYEKDDLVFVLCKNIEARYMLELGTLEIALYKIQCKVLRERRKLSLIQQKLNCKESVIEEKLEEILDKEFEVYQQMLEKQMARLNFALSYSEAESLTEEEAKELKQIYYRVIKELHPDLNPDLTDGEQALFFKAVAAYDAGDIKTMRIIEKVLTGEADFDASNDTIMELMKERDVVRETVEIVKKQIEEIKCTFPYNSLPVLEDSELLMKKREEYEKLIGSETELYKSYKEKISSLLRCR